MPTTNFANVIDDTLVFSNITVTETSVGTVNSVLADPTFGPNAIANPPVPPGAVVTGLTWNGFIGGATGPGSSLSLLMEYDVSSTDPLRAITSIRQNSFVPDTTIPAGATLLLKQEIYSGTTLIGSSLLTRTFGTNDTQDPPFEGGDIALGGAYANVHVKITVSVSIGDTAPPGTSTSFSIMSQSYNSATLPAGLGDYVWEDKNANGIQETGETGIGGVTVQLLDGAGVATGATTVTDGTGFYQFTGLAPGDYSVRFVDPGAGYIATLSNVGSDDAKDSDAVGGVSHVTNLSFGEFDPTLDAGFYKLAGLGDYVFEDKNGNGQQDAGDIAIAGVTVNLLNSVGGIIGSTTTNGVGYYEFINLIPGTYSVDFIAPAGYNPTVANSGADATDSDASVTTGETAQITLVSGEFNPTLDAGYVKPIIIPDAGLGDYVFEDKNYNGIQDGGDVAIEGVTVELLDSVGSVINSTTTDSAGFYQFLALLPGDYQVRFAPVSGYQRTLDDAGSDDAIDSDADAAGLSHLVNLTAGEYDPTIDAGYFRFASLGDYVWLDADADGFQDASEAGIGGVTVKLLDGAGVATGATTSTDGTGFYQFAGLTPGSYGVQFVIPSGYVVSPQDVPADDAKDSDANPTTGKSQIITLMSGEHNPTLDMGLYQLAGLGDYVFEDKNANGQQDGGDVAIAGVTVNLLNSVGGIIGSTTTDGVGYYQFINLVPGTYSVDFIAPAGYVPTAANVGGDTTDSDASVITGETAQVTLVSGEFNPTLDAGYYKLASLGDYVWLDADADGFQDASEAGIGGVTVKLLDGAGVATGATTSTDGTGFYQFAGLTPGSYGVQFVIPSGYVVSPQDVPADDAKDSDANPTTGKSQIITLMSGEHNPTLDMGLYQLAGLGDYVFEDKNANGQQDGGDVAIAGVTVNLLNSVGGIIGSTTTNGVGYYQFINLVPGTYSVDFIAPAGYVPTAANVGGDTTDSDASVITGETAQVTLVSGEFNPTLDAGYYKLASLGDYVWLDADADGFQDASEAGIGGVTVKLLDGAGVATGATTSTDGTGFYQFAGLTPGSYGVQFVIPSGYVVSPQDVPADDAKDSDANPTTGKSQIITLMSGEHNPTLDMGLYQLAGLGDYVFEDKNANGQQDGGDVAIAGVTVNLLNSVGGIIGSTTTNGVGYYQFINLVPGTYSVDFIAPAGYVPTAANVGGDTTDSDASVITGETAQVTLVSGEFNPTLDAGYYKLAGLGDYVWEDTDRDGIQDTGEAPIAGVTVQLLDTNGVQINSTTTNGLGAYQFLGLTPGDYSVRFVTPGGYVPTLANVGSDALDSDAVGGVTQEVTLLSGDYNPTLDAGYYRPTRSLDLEKTTNGPTNSNTTAPNYDNEDAANGAGVPILVAGSAVTWTYKVTNTGETAFAAADIAIVDDNGTLGTAADDMSIANGKITFLSVQSGDADTLLEAGEVWLYKATGIVQNLGGSSGAATTFDFSGSSATSGAMGNVRSFAAGGIAAKASAFSRDTGGAWSTAYLGSYGGGLGVTDGSEGTGGSNSHTVDNTGRDNYVLLTFDKNVVVDSTYLGYVVDDSDIRVWIGTVAGAFSGTPILSDAFLTGLGFTEVNETTLTTARLADINAGNLAGNVLVIAANTGEPTTEDNFKIDQVTVREAGGGTYENKATLTAPGGITDSDLSHYKNGPAPTPGIDLEKTTNGPSNQNTTAPDYDNEDAANGAGVPLLVAGSSVTWTYKVTNTGNTAIAKADIALVDDNGTPSSAADDMTIANGKIVFDSVQVGDADTLLEAGEVWIYKATGTVQNLTTVGATQTFNFAGSTATDGTDGNVRSYTAGGISVKASAASRTDGGSWASGYLGAYGGGLGVTDSSEGTGGGDTHTVDNITRDNYVMFRFDKQVIVDKAYLGYVVCDSDLTVWIGTVSDAFNTSITLSDSVLSGLGFTEVNDTTLTGERWADFNAGNRAGNVVVIAASTADTTPDDQFKIEYLKVQEVASNGVYENKATVNVPGASDSDLSHYKNAPPPVAKIDLEKTTNGPSNSNPCAPTYDNEDAANGSGVPILTAGGAVTWTYKVANTGTTTIAKADIAIVDDNGTPSSASDDMTIANGKITLLSKSVGDSDDLLEAGETWLYQATGTVKDLVTWGASTTFDFSGSSALDGTDGNVRSFTAGGISVKANAWSRTEAGAWANGYLGSYGGGLGVTDRGEGDGSGDKHTVDNLDRDNYVLFRFDQSIVVDKAYLGYVVGDSDMSIWIGNISSAYTGTVTLSDAVLAGLGFTEVNDTTLTSARWADFNAGNLSGNVLVLAASTADTTPDDRFKIEDLVVRKSPDVGIYENKATVYVPGASDSDLSHYTNADIWH